MWVYLDTWHSLAPRLSGSALGRESSLTPVPSRFPSPTWPVSSKSLNVSVFLPQNRDLVFKEDGVEPHLRVDQRHVAKPAGKRIHAALSLGKVVGVSPAGSPGGLGRGQKEGRPWAKCKVRWQHCRKPSDSQAHGRPWGLAWTQDRPVLVPEEKSSTGPGFLKKGNFPQC